jgi:general secretion pathway protein K
LRRPPPAEEGAALLAVLLLVAVMAAVSVVALEKLNLSTHLAANGQAVDQARAYAWGAEALAAARIGELTDPERGKTALTGEWNGRIFAMPVPGGMTRARLRDGGNCFNLNSVAEGLQTSQLRARPLGMAQFVALMKVVGVGEPQARRVAASLADWIDGDGIPGPGGAEDADYAQGTTPYRAANTLLAEASELRAVAGVTPEIYARVRPWVCALPTTEMSPINVNTIAPEQAPLLMMLLPDQLNRDLARQIITSRPPEGWDDVATFWKMPALQALVPPMEVVEQPQLHTRWFGLDLDVEYGGAQVIETALIDGGLSPARVVLRRWGSDE